MQNQPLITSRLMPDESSSNRYFRKISSPCFIIEHDTIQYGISLWIICPRCVHPHLLTHPQPALWASREREKVLKAVQVLFYSS